MDQRGDCHRATACQNGRNPAFSASQAAGVHGQVEGQQRQDNLEEWREVVTVCNFHVNAAARFPPEIQEEEAGQNVDREARSEAAAGRTRPIRRGVLGAATTLVEALRSSGLAPPSGVLLSHPADSSGRSVITVNDAPPYTGPLWSRVIRERGRRGTKPPLCPLWAGVNRETAPTLPERLMS